MRPEASRFLDTLVATDGVKKVRGRYINVGFRPEPRGDMTPPRPGAFLCASQLLLDIGQ